MPAVVKKNASLLAILMLFALATTVTFAIYLERTLQGNINHFMLSAEKFGVPSHLAERGITTLYQGPQDTGWDGQFYYYISNDILGLKDTPKHIDAHAYRYQRVGLSLYAALFAKLSMQEWVSPKFFFLSYLLLISAAVWVGARLYQSRGIPPWLILLWALSAGTQVTLFNALPDAAADAFLILALPLLLARRFWLAAIPMTFSVLSREAYLIIPVLISITLIFEALKDKEKRVRPLQFWLGKLFRIPALYALAAPVAAYAIWWVYVTLHFGATPGSQAHNILGWPMKAWGSYFMAGLTGEHPLVGRGYAAVFEASGLFLFLMLLMASVLVAIATFARQDRVDPVIAGIAGAVLALVGLYACLGPIVMMHYTGYIKVTGVFIILLPLLWKEAIFGKRFRVALILLFGIHFSVIAFGNFYSRFLPVRTNYNAYTRISELSKIPNDQEQACFDEYSARVQLLETNFHGLGNWRARVFGVPFISMKVALTNTSKNQFRSYHGRGAVMMSYHWLNEQGAVVQDGIRSAILPILSPGETQIVQILSQVPAKSSRLVITPVQEGCAWFYMAKPGVELVLPGTVQVQ